MTDSVDMTFALRDILLQQTNNGTMSSQPWRAIGFNLDGLDTQLRTDADGGQYYDSNGCSTPKTDPSTDGGLIDTYPVDGIAGIDNQFGAQLASSLLPSVDPNLQNDLCCMQSLGRGTIMLRIREWNGTANDAKVRLSITSALDGTSADPATLQYVAGTTNGYVLSSDMTTRAAPPSWIPDTDTWYTSRADVSNNDKDQPRHVDVNGYVSGGYFVMQLDTTAPIKLYLGSENGISIGLRYGTMTGHISTNRHLIDDGWIGGRMGSGELLDASYRLLASILYSDAARGVPGGSATSNADSCASIAGTITPLLSMFGDVLANGTNDPTTPCDALSAGVSFHGVRAKDVRVAGGSISIALPDCVDTAVFGTVTPEEALCPFDTPDTCSIRIWNPAD